MSLILQSKQSLKSFIKKDQSRWIFTLIVSLIVHLIIIFPYFPTTVNKHTPRLLSLTEVTLYKKPPPKQKVVEKKIEKKKPKPKPKHVETPPQEIEEPEPEPTEAFEYPDNPKPLYPRVAIQRGWQGTCILEIQILTDGTVGTIVLLKTSGRKLLDQSAIRAVRNWKFEPATKKGKTIKSKLKVPIEFKLE